MKCLSVIEYLNSICHERKMKVVKWIWLFVWMLKNQHDNSWGIITFCVVFVFLNITGVYQCIGGICVTLFVFENVIISITESVMLFEMRELCKATMMKSFGQETKFVVFSPFETQRMPMRFFLLCLSPHTQRTKWSLSCNGYKTGCVL